MQACAGRVVQSHLLGCFVYTHTYYPIFSVTFIQLFTTIQQFIQPTKRSVSVRLGRLKPEVCDA